MILKYAGMNHLKKILKKSRIKSKVKNRVKILQIKKKKKSRNFN